MELLKRLFGMLLFARARYYTGEATTLADGRDKLANASCIETKRPIYVLHTNSGTLIDTYAAHYVDSVWNGGWWYFHTTRFEVWSRYSLALYLRAAPHRLWSGDM